MNYKLYLVLCLHLTAVYSAPMRMQFMPLHYAMQPQNPFLELQNPFLQQASNNMQTQFMYPPQPIIVILPNSGYTAGGDDRYIKLNEEITMNRLKTNTGRIDDRTDAVVLDAEPNSAETDSKKPGPLMPNDPRFSIGTIISYIPFLPIEINVPDTIGWISNFLPGWFQRPDQKPESSNRLSSKGPIPILMLPGPMMLQR